jgi:hypothetical protein
MKFTVARSDDPDWETAPFIVMRDQEVFLDGIQLESEAQALCDMLNQPLKLVPINTRRPTRWISGGVGGRRLAPERS